MPLTNSLVVGHWQPHPYIAQNEPAKVIWVLSMLWGQVLCTQVTVRLFCTDNICDYERNNKHSGWNSWRTASNVEGLSGIPPWLGPRPCLLSGFVFVLASEWRKWPSGCPGLLRYSFSTCSRIRCEEKFVTPISFCWVYSEGGSDSRLRDSPSNSAEDVLHLWTIKSIWDAGDFRLFNLFRYSLLK